MQVKKIWEREQIKVQEGEGNGLKIGKEARERRGGNE